MFTRVSPNLMVPDVNRAVEYYRDVLGFAFVVGVRPNSQEVIAQYDSATPLAFAIVQQGRVQFMFQSQQSFLDEMPQLRDRPLGATATFYVEVADAGLLCRQLQGQADFVSPLHRTFYGKEEFSVRDANGYILCFAGEPKDQMP